jgi:hypothetical protein
MRPIFKTISAAFLFLASAAQSEEAKFKIQGDTLFYSTEDEGITKDFVSISDALHFRTILRDNPEILRINLLLIWRACRGRLGNSAYRQ